MTRNSKAVGVTLLVLGALAAYGVTVWLGKPDSAALPGGPPAGFAIPVEAVPVRVATVNVEINAVGSLLANESVIIRPEIAGRITQVHFTEGTAVNKHDTLVTLDATELRAQSAESAATVQLNQLSFNRAKELVQKKLVSQQDYDQARANLSAAQARHASDQARLDKTIIRAPFDGIVGLKQASPGDYVQAGQDIVNLEDIESLKLDFDIPEVHLAQIQENQVVGARVDSFPNTTFKGTVYAIAPRIDEQTRTVQLRARVPNPDKKLRPGMFARVTVVLQSRNDALLIPEQALVPQGTERFVYRVVEGKATLAKVSIGERQAGEVEIREGLNAGDMVVTAGLQKIAEGVPVQIIGSTEQKIPEATH
jgi:membrane fusion protein (multidrug efflux system)